MKIGNAFPLMNSNEETDTQWRDINWGRVRKYARRLENSIAKAVEHHDFAQVNKLRRIWNGSKLIRLLAVRKVTQDNRGKRTAGIDGVKVTTGKQRLELADKLEMDGKALPLKRVHIPKPNGKTRPLGIPVIKDRAKMELVKGGIQPIYETRAEPNVYGFRPARSIHDAIEAIFGSIKGKPKFVLEGDLTGFFDNIKAEAILESMVIQRLDEKTKKQIKAWIEAGVIDKSTFRPTNKGTPQGGVISPLLANIAFMGLETMLNEWIKTWQGSVQNNLESLTTVVYADDFVVLHEDERVIIEAQEKIAIWCKENIGVELNIDKTRITHTSKGFDFLGFNVRQYPVTTNKQGFKTLIKPSKKSIKEHKEKMRKVIQTHKAAPQAAVIAKLNPIITGWANNFKHVVSKEIFSTIDHYVWQKLWKWAKYRHPKKNQGWLKNKYYPRVGSRKWTFQTDKGETLKLHSDTKIERHIKVRGTKHIYDGDKVYWAKRGHNDPTLSTRVKNLLKNQKGTCTWCNHPLETEEVMEVDHIKPRKDGGKDVYANLQLLHGHCHDTKTRLDAERQKKELLTTSDWKYVSC